MTTDLDNDDHFQWMAMATNGRTEEWAVAERDQLAKKLEAETAVGVTSAFLGGCASKQQQEEEKRRRRRRRRREEEEGKKYEKQNL